jgi:uncharacterized radical SAM superfamily Fe-S cluster-containing enzyme
MRIVQTICPICKRTLAAVYRERGGSVFFEANCPEHGLFASIVAENAEDYAQWMQHRSVTVPPKQAITRGKRLSDARFSGDERNVNFSGDELGANSPSGTLGAHFSGGKENENTEAGTCAAEVDATIESLNTECPLHCGTCENHLMTACCVLLDVTERCNQHCPYCFARADEDAASDPSLETITRWYDRLLELGEERTFNIQLSGGEPTVREDLPAIIKIGKDKGFEYIQLNTNGKRLAEEDGYADALKAAGLSTVFLQFDGTDDSIYEALRGAPLFETKCTAIHNCGKAGLPVTLVPTMVQGVNLHDIGNMMNFMLSRLNVVKGIHFQPVSYFGRHPGVPENPRGRVTMFSVMHEIEKQTGGRIGYDDLVPISTGHQLCCFCGNFLREQDGRLTALLSKSQKEEGISCCCEAEPDPREIIRKDRDFVLNKWVVEESGDESCCADAESCCADGTNDGVSGARDGVLGARDTGFGTAGSLPLSLDEALLYLRRNTFTISGMAFMDRSNLDAERLKRCRVQVFSKDERLIPFCASNSIYR